MMMTNDDESVKLMFVCSYSYKHLTGVLMLVNSCVFSCRWNGDGSWQLHSGTSSEFHVNGHGMAKLQGPQCCHITLQTKVREVTEIFSKSAPPEKYIYTYSWPRAFSVFLPSPDLNSATGETLFFDAAMIIKIQCNFTQITKFSTLCSEYDCGQFRIKRITFLKQV